MTAMRRLVRPRHVVAALALATIVGVVLAVAQPQTPPTSLANAPAAAAPRAHPPAIADAPTGTTPSRGPSPSSAATPAAAPGSPADALPPDTVVPAPSPAASAQPVRTVTGPGISPPPRSDAPLVRVSPPAKPLPPPAPIVPRRMMPVMMEDPATLVVGRIRVRLPGLETVAADAVCTDPAGQDWPCGRRALAGVRALVRGKVVDCPLPSDARAGRFEVACRVGGVDLAERIVAAGWARPQPGESALAEAERRAEARGLGLHAAVAPLPSDPFPDPGDLPSDRTTAPIDGGAATDTTAPAGGPLDLRAP